MARKLVSGSYFSVPLPEGQFSLGQIISIEREAMNSVACVFFGILVSPDLNLENLPPPIAGLLVTPDLLRKGRWPVIGNGSVMLGEDARPYEAFRASGWVGAKIIGSGIVEKFLAAFHGQRIWDEWYDPKYLDGLLLPGVARPTGIKLGGGD